MVLSVANWVVGTKEYFAIKKILFKLVPLYPGEIQIGSCVGTSRDICTTISSSFQMGLPYIPVGCARVCTCKQYSE